ncbi:hypothetical protein D3C71_20920 [compost metagenome]
MSELTINERTYKETKRRLSLLARVVALDVIDQAQGRLQHLVKELGLPDEVARLVRSDVAESILAKDVQRVAGLPDFEQLVSTEQRGNALEAHLFATLVGWILTKTSEEDTAKLIKGVMVLYEEPGQG